MNQGAVERAILELAVEDYFGLWELLWRVNAEKAVRALWKKGWIRLFRGTEFAGDELAVELTEEPNLLTLENWEVPASPTLHVRVGAADQGEVA